MGLVLEDNGLPCFSPSSLSSFVSSLQGLFCRAVTHSVTHFLSRSFLRIYPLQSFIQSLLIQHIPLFLQSSGKMSVLLIALLQLSLLFPNVISTCSTTSNVEFTFYGYPDGPSDTTSFGCSGTQQVTDGTAGGKSWQLSPLTPKPHLSYFYISSLTVHPSQKVTDPTPTPKPSPPPSTTPTSSPAKSSTSPSSRNTSSTWTTASDAWKCTPPPPASTSGSAPTSTAARNKSPAKIPSV